MRDQGGIYECSGFSRDQTDAEFNLPIFLEPEIAEFVQKLALEKDIDRNQIVNMLLKKDKGIIEL